MLSIKKNKVTVTAKSLWDAKKQIIAKLKVPKKDVGLVSVLNKTEYDKQKFRFEGKLSEATDSYVVWSPLLNKVYDGPVSEKEALRLVKKYSKQGQYHVGMQGTKYYNKTKLGKKNPIKESGILYRAGVKKYGKEGMKKIQQAAGKKKSHAAIGAIKDKYEKGKKEGIAK